MRATSEHIGKLVAERHSAVRSKFERLLNALAANDLEKVMLENNALNDALDALSAVLAREHWPSWLVDLLHHTGNYRNNHQNGRATWIAHLKSLMQNWAPMESHVWFSEEGKEPPFDVDKLISAARREYKIDELFERIINILKDLVKCDDLDSAKAMHDLEEVIAMMQKAKSGSFISQVTSWQFVRRFVPNLLTCYLKSSSLAGPAIEAFEQTATELDINMAKAKDDVAEKLLAHAKAGFKSKAVEELTVQQIENLS